LITADVQPPRYFRAMSPQSPLKRLVLHYLCGCK
jgi:hypothetical protein